MNQNRSGSCSRTAQPGYNNNQTESNRACPDYFKWIHEDLKPWRETGITREMVERGQTTAHFRLLIVNGKVFVENYKKSIQTRDAFTLWGILQLLRKYPGKLPDVDLMFDCDDRPVIRSDGYDTFNLTAENAPPVLFRYGGDRWTADIVFPDWSFWGWYVLEYISTLSLFFFFCFLCLKRVWLLTYTCPHLITCRKKSPSSPVFVYSNLRDLKCSKR